MWKSVVIELVVQSLFSCVWFEPYLAVLGLCFYPFHVSSGERLGIDVLHVCSSFVVGQVRLGLEMGKKTGVVV